MRSLIIACLGDSTGIGIGAGPGEGYVDRLRARLEARRLSFRLANLAVSGATARTVLDHQLPRARAMRPDVATVFVGGNDVWRGTTPRDFARTVRAIATPLATAGARVVVVGVPDLARAPAAAVAERLVGLDPRGIAGAIRAMNAELSAVVAADGHRFVDLSSVAVLDSHFCGDGFHPSALGYAALAGAIAPAFTEALDAVVAGDAQAC